MDEHELIFVTGGARSGKSAWAERLATERGAPVLYLATAQAHDKEMAARIASHRRQRPDGWKTVEAPRALAETLVPHLPNGAVVLLDCLTLLASNIVTAEPPPDEPAAERALTAELEALERVCAHANATLIVVSNELGQGLVPMAPISRRYRDIVGRANQRLARRAAAAWLVVSGYALNLKALGVPVG
ncbi:MAG: bifunctional adenosylcobinamide kinase/adenosylcobinamide-phosphate guanylyltransferase [Ardenticatenaceae bacterium]|nr:bifunctional adenosylcobinamide kinase/adenosylcobinamide-phosphate guanylyltransferase [Ardenticatenaceae bacterium]